MNNNNNVWILCFMILLKEASSAPKKCVKEGLTCDSVRSSSCCQGLTCITSGDDSVKRCFSLDPGVEFVEEEVSSKWFIQQIWVTNYNYTVHDSPDAMTLNWCFTERGNFLLVSSKDAVHLTKLGRRDLPPIVVSFMEVHLFPKLGFLVVEEQHLLLPPRRTRHVKSALKNQGTQSQMIFPEKTTTCLLFLLI